MPAASNQFLVKSVRGSLSVSPIYAICDSRLDLVTVLLKCIAKRAW